MKNQLQFKMLLRKIKGSMGRFIAIILIIMLGVLLFVGIKSSGPDLFNNASNYLNEQKASDIQIVSTSGLTDKDLKLAQEIKGATVSTTKSEVVLEKESSEIIQVFDYTKDQKLNKPRLVSGKFPTKENEILLDELALKKDYKLNQQITLKTDNLKNKTFKIVGFATSPLMINKHSRPATNIGNGSVDYFAYIPKANFKSDYYSSINLRFSKNQDLNSFKDEYKDATNKEVDLVETKFKKQAGVRDKEILDQITKQEQQVNQSLTQVKQGLTQAPTNQELLGQQKQLEEVQAEIATTKQKVQQNKTTYFYNTRQDLAGFSDYGALADRITVIADVFPMFFFLIAILITFTTMTRMVEEERTQIGTLKALGYSRGQIQKNYLLYALLAAFFGIVLGIVIGVSTLPQIIVSMMQTQYVFHSVGITFEWSTIIISIALALFATIGAVLIVTIQELRQKPAVLMLPKAPKAGKRILLEKIKPLWQRLSFFRKVSYRNLFRFKSRMWMGIIGVAGGTALILTGFGIRDSINETSVRQFGDVLSYQAIATFRSDDELTKANKILDESDAFKSKIAINNSMVKVKSSKQTVDSVDMMITDQPKEFAKYLKVDEKTLGQKGVLVSTKTADIFGLKKGSTINVVDSNNKKLKFKVAGIAENYVGHFLYLSKDYYESVTNKKLSDNAWLLKTKQMSDSKKDKLATDLLGTKEIVNINFMSENLKVLTDQTASLSPIIWIFVLLSGLLTFVVLYNLTNVNISERVRELSTIKVLGFHNDEVTMYIVRENIILTLFGILLGIVFGNALLWFILQQAMTAQVIFPLTISLVGYISAVGLTILFTLIVSLVTHHKLKNIDMIDALKAND